MFREYEPSHLDETFIVLEPRPVLNTLKVASAVIVQD